MCGMAVAICAGYHSEGAVLERKSRNAGQM